jgi:hypothetical protein
MSGRLSGSYQRILNATKFWGDSGSSNQSTPTDPQTRAPDRSESLQVFGGLALLVLIIAGGWVGWLAFRNDKSKLLIETVTADQSCERVTRILRDVTLTKHGLEVATAQINDETARVRGRMDAAKSEERDQELARLEEVHKEFAKVRDGLPGVLEPFTKSSESNDKENTAATARDLSLAVERFDGACRKLLKLRPAAEPKEDGATARR